MSFSSSTAIRFSSWSMRSFRASMRSWVGAFIRGSGSGDHGGKEAEGETNQSQSSKTERAVRVTTVITPSGTIRSNQWWHSSRIAGLMKAGFLHAISQHVRVSARVAILDRTRIQTIGRKGFMDVGGGKGRLHWKMCESSAGRMASG